MTSEEHRTGRLWRIDAILFSAAFPAIFTFVSQFLLARSVGVDVFGMWLIYRSAAMLLLAFWPTPCNGLIYLMPRAYAESKFSLVRALQRMANLTTAVSITVGVFVAFGIALAASKSAPFAFIMTGFWASNLMLGHTTCLVQGRNDGKAMMLGGLVESGVGIISLFAAARGELYWYIGLLSLRSFLRAVVQYHPAPKIEDGETISNREAFQQLMKAYMPLQARGWVQTSVQYGDRFIVGVLFGEGAAGITGLGSTLAMPTIMVSSAASQWLLPALRHRPVTDAPALTLSAIKQLFKIFVVCALLLPVVPLLVPKARDIQTIAYAFIDLSLLNFLTPATMPIAVVQNLWNSAIWQAASVLLLVAVLTTCHFMGIHVGLALMICAPLLLLLLAIVLRVGASLKWSVPEIIVGVVCGSIIAFGYAGLLDKFNGNRMFIAFCLIASIAYGSWAGRSYLRKMAHFATRFTRRYNQEYKP